MTIYNITLLIIIFWCAAKDRNTGTASLDRIDSKQGYIWGNVQWVHKDINYMKYKFNQDVFLNYCKLIVNYKEL